MKKTDRKLDVSSFRAALATRKTLAALLAACLLLGLLPATALALEDEPAHSHDGWVAVTMGTSYIKLGEEEQTANTLPAGSYYLDADLTVSLKVEGLVDLCLNGHSVTAGSGHAVTVSSGSSLTLCDAPGSTGKLAYTGTDTSYYGIYNQGTLTLHSGAVDGAYRGVCNYSNSTFTMTGGSVTGKDASSGYGVYNYSSSSVFRLSGGSVSGEKYGIYNYSSGSQVYLSGSPSISGGTADIYTNSYSSKIYADDGVDTPTPYSGNAISLRYSSCSNGNTIVYHVTEDIKGKFTLVGSISDNYELKFSEEDKALKFQGKPQALTWYDINGDTLTGEGYPASVPYGTYLESDQLPAAPAVEGKLFLGWLYKKGDASDWSTDYWSDYSSSIRSATSFKADYIDNFSGGGSGTESDPYRLANTGDLQRLVTIIGKGVTAYNNSGVWYKLAENIDLSGVCGEGNNWTPIGYGEGSSYNFKANLDGNGRTISNLYINTSSSYQGLFGGLEGATVKNLTITGSVAAGSDYGALAGWIEDSTVENVDVTGVTLSPYGYTPDGNRTMAYKVDNDDNTIHIQGNYKNNWIQTTYNREGYSVATANLSDGAVTASAEFINGGRYVQLSYTVTAGETAITDGKLAVHADVQIGDNDGAAVEVIQDAAGQVIGLKMVDSHTASEEDAENCVSRDAQFNLYFDGTGGVTPVDTYWFGFYGDRTNINSTYGRIYFAPLNDDTKSSRCTYEQDASGVYTKLTGTDSGFAVSWQNISLDPGESKTYSFILGVGEKADPPKWGDGNAVTLTLAADAAQDRRLVNVSARVKDAAGLTDTLYYSVDGGDGEVLGSVAANGSVKVIDGRLDLSGYAEGSYIFSFWVVNSKGAASASVERTITITADGVWGMDGDGSENRYNVSGTVEDHTGASVAGAEVMLMRGNTKVAGPAMTDANGKYSFAGVAPGSYNVVAAKGGKTMTILVKVVNKSLKEQDLSMPGEEVNSVLDVKDTAVSAAAADVAKVVVGGLDAVAEAVKTDNNTAASVTVTMTVEAKEEATATEDEKTEIDEIKTVAAGKTLEYLAINVQKTVDDGAPEAVTNTGDTVIEIVVPFNFSGKVADSVTVYRYHDGSAEPLKKTDTKTRGTFRLDTANGLIHIYATKFSTYAIGYTGQAEPSTPPSYPPIILQPEHGTITVSPARPKLGDRVTVTVAPEEGYAAVAVTVTGRNGGNVEVTRDPDGTYSFRQPRGTVTVSAEVKTAAAACPRDGTCPLHAFPDADPNSEFHDALHYCVEKGLLRGYDDGLLRTEARLTRGMMVQILYNAAGQPQVAGTGGFVDVTEEDWYTPAAAWATQTGVVKGFEDGSFAADVAITREQIIVMLYRYATYAELLVPTAEEGGKEAAEGTAQLPPELADMAASSWAYDAIVWAINAGLLELGEDGDLTAPITRAQAAVILQGYLGHLAGK